MLEAMKLGLEYLKTDAEDTVVDFFFSFKFYLIRIFFKDIKYNLTKCNQTITLLCSNNQFSTTNTTRC